MQICESSASTAHPKPLNLKSTRFSAQSPPVKTTRRIPIARNSKWYSEYKQSARWLVPNLIATGYYFIRKVTKRQILLVILPLSAINVIIGSYFKQNNKNLLHLLFSYIFTFHCRHLLAWELLITLVIIILYVLCSIFLMLHYYVPLCRVQYHIIQIFCNFSPSNKCLRSGRPAGRASVLHSLLTWRVVRLSLPIVNRVYNTHTETQCKLLLLIIFFRLFLPFLLFQSR